jgi:hypothetical protein
VTFRGVLLLLAVLCAALPSAVQAAPSQVAPAGRQVNQGVAASPFGNPLPARSDPQAWQTWRQQVEAQLAARRAAGSRPNNASGSASGGIIETIAGAVPFQKPVNALKTGFGRLQGIAEDGSGNLYIASCDLGVVLKVDSSSNTTVYAGQPLATGPAVASGDGGPATSARLPCPYGLVFDGAGDLYIADPEAGSVRVVDAATGIIQTIAGNGGPVAAAMLLEDPTGLTLDGMGNLFIADGEFVREVNLATGVVQTIAGSEPTGVQCALSASNTCPATQVSLSLYGSMAVFQNHLYAGLNAARAANNQVLRGAIVSIDLSTGVMQLLAGGGSYAGTSPTYPGIGKDYALLGLTADAKGNVYFTDFSSNLVDALAASDHTVTVVAGSPASGYSGDGGPATMAALFGPVAICLSSKGDVVFVDDFRVRSFAVDGNITTVAGNGFGSYFGDGGPATQAGLDYPASVVADGTGNIYAADQDNGVVRRIDAVTGVITTVAGGGRFGVVGDGGPAVQASLNPVSLALDQAGHLYVSSNGAIRVVDLQSNIISTLVSGVASYGGMVFDGDKTLYVTSGLSTTNPQGNSQVLAVDKTTGATSIVAGTVYTGSPSGDGGPATQAGLGDARGLALDGKGTLFIADEAFSNIRSVDLSTGIIERFAGVYYDTPGPGAYSGDGGQAIHALLSNPTGLAYDGSDHLIIADSGNNVLRQIDLSNNIITTLAGNHTAGFGGDGGAATGAMLYYPSAVTFDRSGNLIIADTNNNRVRRAVLHPTNLKATLMYAGGSSPSGDSITFTATYTGLSFGIAPTGTVTFSTGTTTLGSGTMAPATDGSGNYVATFTSTSLPVENAIVTAEYSGDVHYAAATTTITFQQLGPSYSISANPASLTVKQGSSGSVTFTVTSQNGFNQAVSFTCDGTTLPKGVACSFQPASVTPNGSGAVTTTLTVQTTGTAVAALNRPTTRFPGWLPRGGSVLALLLLGIPRVRRRMWLGGAALMFFALCLTGMLGCGGGGANSGSGAAQNANATPAGSYSIRVTTLAGSASGAAPVTVSLTVTE